MTKLGRVRAFLGPLIVVVVGAALVYSAVRFSHTATARTGTPLSPGTPAPATGAAYDRGVVCFGTVDLERGVAELYPLQTGRVAQVFVAENQAVAQGTELLRLEDSAARGRLAEADAAVTLAQLQLRQARHQPELHRRRVAQQEAMLEAATSRVAAARRVFEHEEKLAKSVVINESEKSVSEDRVRELQALERAERERLAESREQDVDLAIERAEYELKAAEARREQTRLAWEECHIKAPRAGTVLRVLVGPGDVLGGQPARPAVLFAADGPQIIRATVEQEFASRVKEGERASVEDDADPTAIWRGQVQRVAGWYNQRRTILHDPSQLSDVRTLECVIVLDAGQPRLRLGQSVRITIGAVPQ